ncbi:hypothetical protein BACCAC_01351 [Bacteroides caccae ATCC 43185]|nr:hypothetical protein BACCAC_01351 [Bacteroides caccae ATCC 43185]
MSVKRQEENTHFIDENYSTITVDKYYKQPVHNSCL